MSVSLAKGLTSNSMVTYNAQRREAVVCIHSAVTAGGSVGSDAAGSEQRGWADGQLSRTGSGEKKKNAPHGRGRTDTAVPCVPTDVAVAYRVLVCGLQVIDQVRGNACVDRRSVNAKGPSGSVPPRVQLWTVSRGVRQRAAGRCCRLFVPPRPFLWQASPSASLRGRWS